MALLSNNKPTELLALFWIVLMHYITSPCEQAQLMSPANNKLIFSAVSVHYAFSVRPDLYAFAASVFLHFLPSRLSPPTPSPSADSLRYTSQGEPFNLHSAPCIKQCTFSTVKPHFTAWSLCARRSERLWTDSILSVFSEVAHHTDSPWNPADGSINGKWLRWGAFSCWSMYFELCLSVGDYTVRKDFNHSSKFMFRKLSVSSWLRLELCSCNSNSKTSQTRIRLVTWGEKKKTGSWCRRDPWE